MNQPLPKVLVEYADQAAEHARREGLDFYETIFEMLSIEQMNQVAAYGGFPQRYPHWRFGMEYERMRKQHTYGLGKIYEMVINNDPCYAYLLTDNALVDQKTVIAHVYGHSDFFKNNIWFSKTNRKMMDGMANHATRVRRYISRYGLDEVEAFIDTCLSLENLIDPHSVFMKRCSTPNQRGARAADFSPRGLKSATRSEHLGTRYPAKPYMDRYINPPDAVATEHREKTEAAEEAALKYPEHPQRDVLLFLLTNAPLDDWRADILGIIREEAYYFAPQGQTKIMNEGWASYWHSTILTNYTLNADELISYCDHHSSTLATSPGRLNPYKLGIELLRDIERRWNTGRHGLEYERCTSMEERRAWGQGTEPEGRIVGLDSPGRRKIFEVRRIYNDVTFLDEFLTPEFVEDQKLYHYRYDPATQRMVVVDRDFKKIKAQMLFMLTNHAQPYIYVLDGNYRNRGELYLGHRHTGVDMEIRFAVDTLKQIHKIWGRPVHIHAMIDDEPMLFSFDGEQSTQQQVDESVPVPAHDPADAAT
ncbi:MAG: SpoVR family protein [Planctomycetes bacterium]|nr:SpoVR family protein [Planctomycetota bacterium]